MNKYLYYFESLSDYKNNLGNNYEEPWVSYTEGAGLNYNLKGYEKHLYMPFTIEALTDGIISVKIYSGIYLNYKKTGSPSYSQISGQSSGNIVNIPVTAGDEIVFRGDNTSLYSNGYSSFHNVPNGGAQFKVKGNVLSLLNASVFWSEAVLTTKLSTAAFQGLFITNTNLISAKDLILPSTVAGIRCYQSMFSGCTNLTEAPSILSVTTLAPNCYTDMFLNCTSLEKAPELPATTLVSSCYSGMFKNCHSLNYVKAMFTTTPGVNTSGWLSGVSATGTFVKNAAATWTTTGVSGVPTGWTVETTTE